MIDGNKKIISILGSTGSIGKNTLEVIRNQRDSFSVIGLSAGGNVEELARQIVEFSPEYVSVMNGGYQDRLCEILREYGYDLKKTTILSGESGVCTVATLPTVNLVVSAIVGFSGLAPTYHAIRAGKQVALANKEVLVAAGELMMKAVAEFGIDLIPVDSEHNAIFQCLRGENTSGVHKIWLTASGGPFRTTPMGEFSRITPEKALKHPTWQMGPKITIDSATMMNKGLEIIEAHWLFQLPGDMISVVVHPQSVIHSMVEFVDGSFIAQLGATNMKLPIHFALNFPNRISISGSTLNLFEMQSLEFYEPDFKKFPCLTLSYEVLENGGAMPTVLNAANEIAVNAFLERRVSFPDIPRIIRKTLDSVHGGPSETLEQVVHIDHEARQVARSVIKTMN